MVTSHWTEISHMLAQPVRDPGKCGQKFAALPCVRESENQQRWPATCLCLRLEAVTMIKTQDAMCAESSREGG